MIVARPHVKYDEFFRVVRCELKVLKQAKRIENEYDFSQKFYRLRRDILVNATNTLDSIWSDLNTTTELVHTVVGQTQTLERLVNVPSTNFFQIWKMLSQWVYQILFQEIYLGNELSDFQSYFRKFMNIYVESMK